MPLHFGDTLDSSIFTPFKQRPRLGKPPAELTQDIEEIYRATRGVVWCGLYEEGAELKVDKITALGNSGDFKIQTRNDLTIEQLDAMKATPHITYPTTGELMYRSRPYDIKIGEIKLYYDKTRKSVYRAKVVDLYTLCVAGSLVMKAKIYSLEIARFLYVVINDLYDFPQRIKSIRELEPQVDRCRLLFGQGISGDIMSDKDIFNEFRSCLKTINSNKPAIVRILDYKDDIYMVDLIRSSKSLIEHLKQKYPDKFVNKIDQELLPIQTPRDIRPFGPSKLILPLGKNFRFERPESVLKQNKTVTKYFGPIEFFKRKLIEKDERLSYFNGRLFRVRLVSWNHPRSIFIIPDDDEFLDQNARFIDDIQNLINDMVERDKSDRTKKSLKVGDMCIFKYNRNTDLGRWLRGIITKCPTSYQNGDVDFSPSPLDYDFNLTNKTIPSTHIPYEHQVYEVLSVDYGFKTLRLPWNIIRVKPNHKIAKLEPFSLRCELFGVRPLLKADADGLTEYPDFCESCLDKIDYWVRERLTNHSYYESHHYVLLHDDMTKYDNRWNTNLPNIPISLFHRFDPKESNEEILKTKVEKVKTYKYDCINVELIESGLAGGQTKDLKKKSNVEYDLYVVNMLLQCNLL